MSENPQPGPNPSLPQLPVELTDAIIDCLAESPPDREALKTSALVCRAWSPRAQQHLFRRMTWVVDVAAQAADARFGDLSLGTRRYVRHLSIHFPSTINTLEPLDLSNVQELLSSFSSVRTLKVIQRNMTYIPLELAYTLAAAFPHLRTLVFAAACFLGASDLLSFLCEFKELRHLAFGAAHTAFNTPSIATVDLSPSLATLSIGQESPLVGHLLRRSTALSSLEFRFYDVSKLNILLEEDPLISLQLEELNLLFFPSPVQASPFMLINLSRCHYLTTLTLSLMNSFGRTDITLDWVAESLATLPPSHPLHTLILINYVDDKIPQASLEHFSGIPSVAKLRHLRIYVERSDRRPQKMDANELSHVQDVLRRRLSSLSRNTEIVIDDTYYRPPSFLR